MNEIEVVPCTFGYEVTYKGGIIGKLIPNILGTLHFSPNPENVIDLETPLLRAIVEVMEIIEEEDNE